MATSSGKHASGRGISCWVRHTVLKTGLQSFDRQVGNMFSVGDRQYIISICDSHEFYIPIQECISRSCVSGLQDCEITLFDINDYRGEQQQHLNRNFGKGEYFRYILIKG